MKTDAEMKAIIDEINEKYAKREALVGDISDEEMISEMLKAGQLMLFSRSWSGNEGTRYSFKVPEGVMLVINLNDWFYWACSDFEYFGEEDIPYIYAEFKKEPRFGVQKWASKKRNMRPQVPWVKDLKKFGIWDDEWEALPSPEPS